MMLSQGAKHDQIWRHESDYDNKATRRFAWMYLRRMEVVIDGEDSRSGGCGVWCDKVECKTEEAMILGEW
jgi:hypothetical protein